MYDDDYGLVYSTDFFGCSHLAGLVGDL